MRQVPSKSALFVIALLAFSGCGYLAPSDPPTSPLALRKVGDQYFIRLGGDCSYADATVVKMRADDGTDTVWEAWLPAGSTENEILVGDSAHGVVTHIPLTTQPLVRLPGWVAVTVSDPNRDTPMWSGDFVLTRVGDELNGGSAFDDGPVAPVTLDAEAEC